jgi:hypothetical protein
MINKKKIIVLFFVATFVVLGVAATRKPVQERNLKVLPKDISDAKLDSIMHSYNVALGVSCNFCHVPFDKAVPDSLNFPSDKEPMKENARQMLRMTIDINKNNFYFDSKVEPVYLTAVTCKTCHRGEPFPPEFH